MTYLELIQELEHILGERQDLESRIRSWINMTLVRVARLFPFEELKSFASGETSAQEKVYRISLLFGIDDLRQIEDIRLIDGNNSWKLTYVPGSRLDREEAEPAIWGFGRPRRYSKWGNWLEFVDQIPNKEYTLYLRYHRRFPVLLHDTQEPLVTYLDDFLIASTAAWAYATLQENADSQYWATVAMGLWRDIYKDLQKTYDYTPRMKGFSPEAPLMGEYWNNPFVKGITE
jgi:hypothetical protein